MNRFAIVLALLLLPTLASAQTLPAPEIIACDPSTIPAANRNLPVWRAAGVAPVAPEVREEVRMGRDAREVVAEVMRGPSENDSDEKKARLTRAHARVMIFNQIHFTPQDTDINNLPPLPDDFQEAFRKVASADQLEKNVIECGDVVHYVVGGAPDLVVGDKHYPKVEVKDAHVLGWCQKGVTGPNGKCGAEVVQTKELIELTSGINAGNSYRFQMILNCGNPNAQLHAPGLTTEGNAPMPREPGGRVVPGTLQIRKQCAVGATQTRCGDDMTPEFEVSGGPSVAAKQFGISRANDDERVLVTGFELLPGRYRFTEKQMRGYVVKYLDGQDFEILSEQVTTKTVVNTQPPVMTAAVPPAPRGPKKRNWICNQRPWGTIACLVGAGAAVYGLIPAPLPPDATLKGNNGQRNTPGTPPS